MARLEGPGTRWEHRGYGEEMPLEEVRVPFAGDHWWYPQRTYWRVRAEFGGERRELVGGEDRAAESRFRRRAADDLRSIGGGLGRDGSWVKATRVTGPSARREGRMAEHLVRRIARLLRSLAGRGRSAYLRRPPTRRPGPTPAGGGSPGLSRRRGRISARLGEGQRLRRRRDRLGLPAPGRRRRAPLARPGLDRAVAHAKRHAEALGLGCDFTFGTLWPFGGSFVPPEDSHHTFDGPSYRPLEQTWESAYEDEPGLVLDHLDREALARYAQVMGAALAPALGGARRPCSATRGRSPPGGCGRRSSGTGSASGSATTCASIVDRLDEDEHARYDYRAFIADAVLDEFYRPFTEICHGLGAVSRVQCHGAPTDLIAAYGAVDVPETEVLLFPPPFARIAASAAALGGKPVVSCETFTCPYGFPAVHFKAELASDLRLLADAAIAHGVNQVVWHGMPYNPPGGSNAFFATTHVGPDSAFAAEIPALNAYLADACSWMRRGRTYAGLAVYLPVEDNRMRDRLPPALRTPAAQFYWELRQEVVPEEAEPYDPLWVSAATLEGATWDGTKLRR